MRIVFMLKQGAIEWEVPEGANPPFHFATMVTQVAMAGYFLSDNLYIRHSELVGISISGETGPLIKPVGSSLQ